MSNIKICFLHGDIVDLNNKKEKLDYFRKYINLKKEYLIDYDEKNPDIVFVSEHLYYGKNTNIIKDKFKKLLKNNPITVFIAGECIEPDLNIFDYAIVFDRNTTSEDRIIRIPYFNKFYRCIFEKSNKIKTIEQAKKELNQKKKFCNFIYSNPNAHPMRDKLFYSISKYKQVEALGKHLNNVSEYDEKNIRIQDWRLQSIKYKENYKFSIASENAQYDGYISEKLYTSFQAHTIPIYFGDKRVDEEFNPKAFINVSNFENLDKLNEYIKKIDNDDSLYLKYIMEPWLTKEQLKIHNNIEKNYYDFFNKLFTYKKEKLYRKSIGFHPQNYRESFFINNNDNNNGDSFIKKLRRFIIPYKLRKGIKDFLHK